MKLKKLTTALILAALPTAGAFAAALDRSGQSIAAFLQPGNYFEAGISVLDPDVSGTTNAALGSQNTGDIRVGRDNNLIAVFQTACLFPCSQNQG